MTDAEMPEPIEAGKPICPHCEYEYCETEKEYVEINCSCGWKFEVQRVFICRPFEQRR